MFFPPGSSGNVGLHCKWPAVHGETLSNVVGLVCFLEKNAIGFQAPFCCCDSSAPMAVSDASTESFVSDCGSG